MKIHLKDDPMPFKTNFTKWPSIHQEPTCRHQTEELKAAKVIREVMTGYPPSHWLAPAFLVQKPGQPGKMRLVTDFSRLNS